MNEPIHIISLGAGVQSSTMALMAAAGEIGPMPTAAIFADTQAEPASVYTWLDWLEKQLPYPVIRVSSRDIAEVALTMRTKPGGGQWVENVIPAHVDNGDGTSGMIQRQCTLNFKIVPITKEARRIGGIKRGQTEVGVIQWIGISLDEAHRMKPSRDKWQENRWPLIDLRMKRHDCLRWMERNGYPVPPRSACYFCPMKSNAEWKLLRDSEPEEFAKAVAIDKQHRELKREARGDKGLPYLHRSCVPLDQVDLSTDEERGQGTLWGNECEGMCGV